MNKLIIRSTILAIILLGGCTGPLVKVDKVNKLEAKDVKVYKNKSILQNNDFKILGVVEATSCKHLLWQPDSTLENCVDQLRQKSLKLGANAVYFGSSESKSADFSTQTGINRNCWNTVDCSGVALIKKN